MSNEPTVNDVLDNPTWKESNLLITIDDGYVSVYDTEDDEAVLIDFEVLHRINRKVKERNKPDTKTGIKF